MSQSRESKNKALVLKAFDTLFNSETTRRLNAFGPPTTSSTVRTSSLAAKASSI